MKPLNDTKKNQRGFSLIELMIVIAIIGILIGVGIDFAIQVHNRVEEEVVLDKAVHVKDVAALASVQKRLEPRGDGEVTLDELAAHVTALSAATDLPVSVDLENGYGADPEDAARAISRAACSSRSRAASQGRRRRHKPGC